MNISRKSSRIFDPVWVHAAYVIILKPETGLLLTNSSCNFQLHILVRAFFSLFLLQLGLNFDKILCFIYSFACMPNCTFYKLILNVHPMTTKNNFHFSVSISESKNFCNFCLSLCVIIATKYTVHIRVWSYPIITV